MHRLHALLAIATLLALLAISTMPGSARPVSLAEMGLQTVGAAAGQAGGWLLGLAISLPSFSGVVASCEDVPDTDTASGSKEAFKEALKALFACVFEGVVPVMALGSNVGLGGGLGTLAGIVLAAQLQGREGSVLGAIAGVFVGQALMYYVVSEQTSAVMGRLALSIELEEENAPDIAERELTAVQWATAWTLFLPVLLGVLGYNLL